MSVTLNNYGKMANMNTAEFYGKSTDEKPTEQNGGNIINGSIYVEIDTGRAYFYDAEMKMWTPVTPPSADGTYTKEQIDALLNKKMSYYIVTVDGNKIVHEGETLTYAKIQQLYEDESVFIYMEHAGLTLIPSVDVDNSIIAFSSDWMRKEGTGYEPFIYVVQITSDNTVTSQQFQIEDVANKVTVINGRNATSEEKYPSVKAVVDYVDKDSINAEITDIKEDLTELQRGGYIADQQQIGEKVSGWLDEHPEVTTTVQDGSLTEEKFTNSLKLKTIKDYVTPEMFGAVGDGESDDTEAINSASQYCKENKYNLYFCQKTYKITSTIIFEGINVKSDGTILNSSDKPCIKIQNSSRCSFEFNEIRCYTNVYKALNSNSIDYSIGIVFQNSSDCRVSARQIINFVSGIVLISTEGKGVYYNVVNVKSFNTCFNGIRIVASDSIDSVNGNLFEYAKFDYHTWNTDDKPYCIMIDSYASSGTPYANNSNYFDNLFVEYGLGTTRYPRLVKSEYGNNNYFNFRRIEIGYRDEGTNKISDCFEYGGGVRNYITKIEFSWRNITFNNQNSKGNRVWYENGIYGLFDSLGNRMVNLSEQIETGAGGLSFEFVECYMDLQTGLVTLSLACRCQSDISAGTQIIKNIPYAKTSKLLSYPLSKGSLWNKPTESVSMYLNSAYNYIVNNAKIDFDSYFQVNFTYYTNIN